MIAKGHRCNTLASFAYYGFSAVHLFRVELLGGCRILNARTGLDAGFRTRKAKCVLALVLLSEGATINREKLASLLWDPAPEDLARGSLRQALKELRDVVGRLDAGAISTDRFSVSAVADLFDVDLLNLHRLLEVAKKDRAAALQAASLWKGELFGLSVPGAPVFEAWVYVERSHLRGLLTMVLTDHLVAALGCADFSDPGIADQLVRIEPSHELAHQYLMHFHATRGDQAAALRQYALLDHALAEELDSEPSEESTNLLVAIKRGDIGLGKSEPALAKAPVPVVDKGAPRITIRPPLTRYDDDSRNYLAEGFAYMARTCLARFRSWIVIPWPATGYDPASTVDYTDLGRVTGADFVVDLVFDWRGPKGKLFVTLIECRDASEVWSKSHDIAALELQELSANVAGSVASNLASQVNYVTLLRYARKSPAVPAAHDLWLRAHQLSRRWTASADAEAELLLGQALDLDPGLASAHTILAQILSTRTMVRPGYAEPPEDRKLAFWHAQKAIDLDPYDSRCHIGMAWNWLIAKSAERAKSHFRLAAELNPHDAETLIAAASGMAFLGQMHDAVRWSQLALQLNPIFPEYYTGYLASIHFLNNDFKAAISTVESCPDVFPHLAIWKACALVNLGHHHDAHTAYAEFRSLTTSLWEGKTAPDDAALENWLLDTLPIVWVEGRTSLQNAVRRARGLSGNHAADMATGNAG